METTEAVLLRIYLNEDIKWEHRPLYEVVVTKARENGLSGATVLRGPMGFGRSTEMHTAKILDLSINLPIVVEIVESEAKVTAFLSILDGMLAGGLVTIEKVRVVSIPRAAPQ
jgi:uncharacterized protein